MESLYRLSRSDFRGKFHLTDSDLKYIKAKGLDKIESHAADFISKRLAPAIIPNDGKQTPWKGHPVFVAQHACACCCRGCLEKWHKIPRGRALTEEEQRQIRELLMAWISQELNKNKGDAPL